MRSRPIIQPLEPEWYQPYVQAVDMLRLDLLHPIISGNKWYKLKYNIQHAVAAGYKSILTFGGGFSNHLIAAAAAAKEYNLSAIGIIRGHYPQLTPTLAACQELGMQLIFVPKAAYERKTEESYLQELSIQYDHPFIIPEGGANEYGRKGIEEIAALIPASYTHICVSVGTGTTLAGLRNALPISQHISGFAPMKNGNYLKSEMAAHLSPAQNNNWQLYDAWHFGGFGKYNEELISFMNSFNETNQVPLDMVYTAKMMYGVKELLQSGRFPANAALLCIHTGGLQGNASIQDRLLY
jgi:1-aminocyclopropane-1-carboxylate deaminase